MKKYIDLHLHSTFSDGQFNPKILVEKAEKNNVGIISITDHDDIRSVKELKKLKINYINGVELSSITNINDKQQRIHILGYGYNEDNISLINHLENKRYIRNEINKKYLSDMLKKNKYISNEILTKIETDKFSNLYKIIIKYLEEENYTLEQLIEIKKYLNENKIQYPNYEFKDEEAIKLIIDSGGIPVLAHPYQYNLSYEQEDNLIKRLKNLGLLGIEIYHSGDSEIGMKIQKRFCEKYNLEWTIGSDYHTDYDDFGNEIGLGKNNNLCIENCSLTKKLKI